MNDMNGHESANQHLQSVAGFILLPSDQPMPGRLTKQQQVILRHLQTKGSITPWVAKAEYRCASVHGVISKLRQQGWDIETYRCKDEDGKRFPSYRLETEQAGPVQDEAHVPLLRQIPETADDDPAILPDDGESEEPPPPEDALEIAKPAAGKRKLDIIKEHLLAGGTISPQTAMDIHGMTGGSLTAIICRLRKENWDITSIPATDDSGYMSYRLAGVEPMVDALPTETRKHDAVENASPAPGAKVRFIVPLDVSETSVTLSRADFDFMMRIVSAGE